MQIGKLEPVELRELWNGEASDFTPWLAQEDNIELLSEAINLELEVQGQEEAVGPFRADILCKDTLTIKYVLIENQLEKTDHTHLGQLLTYAAGLDAAAIIWIAKKFTEEHRAALDWLNDITTEDINFFGIEIEVWKIGDSYPAPKFNLVAKPNEWTKVHPPIIDLTEAGKLKLEFWTALRDYILANSNIRPQKPSSSHWTNYAIGKSGYDLAAIIDTQKKLLRIEFNMYDDIDNEKLNHIRSNFEDAAFQEISKDLVWNPIEGRKQSNIYLIKRFDVWDKNNWPEQHQWIREYVEKFDKFFRPVVKNM